MPANLVNAESVSKSYGAEPVLSDVSLGVAAGDRIGVVGRNGGGKSTLLALLTMRESPDSGRVTHARGLRVGALPQRVDFTAGTTVRDAVLRPDIFSAEHEWAGDAKIRGVLAGLGLPDLGLDSAVASMSGGERRRVALAAELIHDTDLLALDEPTNHLDVEAITWLAEHLTTRRGGLLVVTHDRWFLDAVCTRTWEVEGGRVRAFDGGYAAYVLARAVRARLESAAEERRNNLLRKELAWLRRGPPARTSKPRFRIDAAQALIEDQPPVRDEVALRGFATRRLGRSVYDVEDVSLRLGDRELLHDLTWRVGPGDRSGVVGVNGSGKTSLLRLLVGELTPDSGAVKVGQTVAAAYLSQELIELPGNLRVLQAVEEIGRVARFGRVELSASSLLERFGFGAAQQWTPVADLSGGERRRLALLRLLMTEPNVLLLDEPTNDLDIDTLTALEDLLDSWPGTLIVVSHDRYLLERVCDRVVALLGDGGVTDLPGGVEEYLRRRSGTATVPSAAGPAPGRGAGRTGDTRAVRKELARLERELSGLDHRETDLQSELARHATDFAKTSDLDAALREVRARRGAVEERWLQLAESDAAGAS